MYIQQAVWWRFFFFSLYFLFLFQYCCVSYMILRTNTKTQGKQTTEKNEHILSPSIPLLRYAMASMSSGPSCKVHLGMRWRQTLYRVRGIQQKKCQLWCDGVRRHTGYEVYSSSCARYYAMTSEATRHISYIVCSAEPATRWRQTLWGIPPMYRIRIL